MFWSFFLCSFICFNYTFFAIGSSEFFKMFSTSVSRLIQVFNTCVLLPLVRVPWIIFRVSTHVFLFSFIIFSFKVPFIPFVSARFDYRAPLSVRGNRAVSLSLSQTHTRVPRHHTRAQFSVSTLPGMSFPASTRHIVYLTWTFFFPRAALSIPYKKGKIADGNWIQEMTRMKAIGRRFAVSVILVHCMIYCVDQSEKKSNICGFACSARDTLRNIHGTLAVTQCREVNWKKKCRAAL